MGRSLFGRTKTERELDDEMRDHLESEVENGVRAGTPLSAVLYGISPHDPATYITALLIMLSVTLLACWHPIRRALRIDPALTLRSE